MKINRVFILYVVMLLIITACGGQNTSDPSNLPCDGDITWERALEIVETGDVAEIYQLHSLEVELVLKDGCRLNTVEPLIDDIFKAVEACGAPCSEIILATE
jgi:hypothetical protein